MGTQSSSPVSSPVTTAIPDTRIRATFAAPRQELPLLLAIVPGAPKEALVEHIVSQVQKTFKRRLNIRAIETLRALLSHLGFHSDRVWASHICLGIDIVGENDPTKDQGAKLAERGVEDLVKAGLIRIITDQKELLAGPGEHDYIARGKEKKGLGAVNHYVLLLHDYVAPWFIKAWRALVSSVRQDRPHPSEPPADLATVWEGRAAFAPVVLPQPDPDELDELDELDPLASDEEKAAHAERMEVRRALAEFAAFTPSIGTHTTDSPVPDLVGSPVFSPSCSPSLSMVPAHHMAPCNVDSEDNNNEAKLADGAQPTQQRGKKFAKTKVSSVRTTRTCTRENEADKPANGPSGALPLISLLSRKREHGGFGFDLPGAQSLIRHYSEPFLRTLLAYTLWMEAQTGAVYGPGWIIQTARNFKTWPQEFRQHQDQQKRREERERLEAQQEARRLAAVQESRAGIAEPLRSIWQQFLQEVREVAGITPGFWATNLVPLRNVTLSGDTVTIQALFERSYTKLVLEYAEPFARVLQRLLGCPIQVQFITPEPQACAGRSDPQNG